MVEELIEKLTTSTDERDALYVLVLTRALADEHQIRSVRTVREAPLACAAPRGDTLCTRLAVGGQFGQPRLNID